MQLVLGLAQIALGDVGGVEHGLFGEQEQGLGIGLLLLAKGHGAGGQALVQRVGDLLEDLHLLAGLGVAGLGDLAGAVHALLHGLQVGVDQLEVDGLHVTHGIDGAVDVGDVFVLKAADDVHDGVHLADVGEEFVAQTLAARRAAHQARDVHKLDDGGGVLFGVVHLGQHVQTAVGHRHHAGVGLYRAKRVVRGLRARLGDRVEQRALADVRQSHNAKFHSFKSS